ncbi:MAG TPA: hypothetical protein VFV19_19335 [Candidatus Polarisedimenticolaceae bacterium]|nr:hypothetical protein [Candidatus Polarisedimenticolaceae bacterium]
MSILRLACVPAVLLLASGALFALQPVSVESHALLHLEAIAVGDGPAEATGITKDAEVGPRRPEIIDLRVPWGDGALDVRLTVALAPTGREDGEITLRCSSTVTPTGRGPARATRDLSFADGGSGLFEIFGDGARRLVLTLHGERVDRAVAGPIAPPGDPVRFLVAVEGVAGDHSEVLQTNELHSFVGESVAYEFRLGSGANDENLRLVLVPESIDGELITIRAEIKGLIPGADGPVKVDRTQRIVATRRATTPVPATVGTPPSGYRFQITPDF